MKRRKTSLGWGRRSKAAAAKAAAEADAARKSNRARNGSSGGFGGTSMTDASMDYGRYYDKINARGKCDDLVLLEDVSNEGIVEVIRARERWRVAFLYAQGLGGCEKFLSPRSAAVPTTISLVGEIFEVQHTGMRCLVEPGLGQRNGASMRTLAFDQTTRYFQSYCVPSQFLSSRSAQKLSGRTGCYTDSMLCAKRQQLDHRRDPCTETNVFFSFLGHTSLWLLQS